MGFHSQKQSWEDYQNEVIDESEVGPVCHLEFLKRSWKKKKLCNQIQCPKCKQSYFQKPILDNFEDHHIFNKIDIFLPLKIRQKSKN